MATMKRNVVCLVEIKCKLPTSAVNKLVDDKLLIYDDQMMSSQLQ